MKMLERVFGLLLFLLPTAMLFAQGVVINELYNSSGNDEWVELLVVKIVWTCAAGISATSVQAVLRKHPLILQQVHSGKAFAQEQSLWLRGRRTQRCKKILIRPTTC